MTSCSLHSTLRSYCLQTDIQDGKHVRVAFTSFPFSFHSSVLSVPPAVSPSSTYLHLAMSSSTGEFSTPVGGLIEQATSESLVNTDWALNLQICDEVSTHHSFAHSSFTCFGCVVREN